MDTHGDGTIRTAVADIARQIQWPKGFTARIRRNAFTHRWHGRESELEASIATEGPKYRQAFVEGDPENTGVWFGEASGLIHSIESADAIVKQVAGDAATLLQAAGLKSVR